MQPRIGVTGARAPTVLVAEPCRVAPEPGASPLGQTGCRRCPVPPGCVAARPGLMAGKEPLLSALRGERGPRGSSGWGLGRGCCVWPCRSMTWCLRWCWPCPCLVTGKFSSFCLLPGWVSPCSHTGHLPRHAPRATCSPAAPKGADPPLLQVRCCGCGRTGGPARTPHLTSLPSASCWRASCARGSDVSVPGHLHGAGAPVSPRVPHMQPRPSRSSCGSSCPAEPVWGFRRRDYWHCLEQLPQGDGGR